ncbi:MAG: 5-formyltetrahydrofolate cyclo-ligase [Phycisphaerae bacterium]
MTKKELRQKLRRRLDEIPPDELAERSALACGRLLELPEYRRAEIVMIFLSTPKEVDTSQIALHCWSNMKRVLAPKVSWEQRRMLPTEIKSLTSDVHAGMLGIREPIEGLPIPVADIDLVIVPGLGFDAAGNRLGRGRGFYDGFLSHRDFRGVSCALALEDQVVEKVPSDETDVRVHILVTDARVRRFRR